MTSPDFIFYFVIAIVILLIGLSKGGLGGTTGGAATPLMALVLPVDEVVGVLLPLLMMADVFAVVAHWQRWNYRLLLLLVPASLLGITLGTALLTSLSPDALRVGLALLVLLFVAYRLGESRLRQRLTYRPRPWHGIAAGTTAGFTSTLAHVGGPPVAIYLLLQDLTPTVFVATSAVYFAIINWLKVPYYVYAGILDLELLQRIGWLLPLVPFSVLLGRVIAHRINKQAFDRLVIVLLLGSAVLLLLR